MPFVVVIKGFERYANVKRCREYVLCSVSLTNVNFITRIVVFLKFHGASIDILFFYIYILSMCDLCQCLYCGTILQDQFNIYHVNKL